MDYSAISELYLVAINAALVGLDRQRRIVRPAFSVGFDYVLIDMDYCFHRSIAAP
tara:strand:- start:569 stop:733 length:165 start_codon:yes stop_codon:yes gene_type:complete